MSTPSVLPLPVLLGSPVYDRPFVCLCLPTVAGQVSSTYRGFHNTMDHDTSKHMVEWVRETARTAQNAPFTDGDNTSRISVIGAYHPVSENIYDRVRV